MHKATPEVNGTVVLVAAGLTKDLLRAGLLKRPISGIAYP